MKSIILITIIAITSPLYAQKRPKQAKNQKESTATVEEKEYRKVINKADECYAIKDFVNAKKYYERALNFKPNDPYPRQKLVEIYAVLAGSETTPQTTKLKCDSVINIADQFFLDKKYNEAKAKYMEALAYKADLLHPKHRIQEIDQILADEKNKQTSDTAVFQQEYLRDAGNSEERKVILYKAYLAKGDRAMTMKNYAGAKQEYLNALKLCPNEEYPKQKILEIDQFLAAEDGQNKINAYNAYTEAIFKADVFFNQKSYAQAKSVYKEALVIDSTATYPKDKIQEIDKHIAQINAEKERSARYDQLIYGADMLFAAKKYSEAKAKYEEALAVIPTGAYPKQKLEEINKFAMSARDETARYPLLIKEGDSLFALKKYDEAKAKYTAASTVKSTETYPREKLAEIHKIMETTDTNPKTEAYNKLIAEADMFYKNKDYAKAKEHYEKALLINAGAVYPRQRITEIIAIQNQDE